MKRALFLPVFIICSQLSYAYNPFWIAKDKWLITGISKLNKNDPRSIESFFINKKLNYSKDKLGFGWTRWNTGIGGGYISIQGEFIYFNDSIVSYIVEPDLPVEKGLYKMYKKWYQNSFEYSQEKILPYYYHQTEICKALPQYRGHLNSQSVSENLRNYMSPYAGTTYGYRGGYPFHLLKNRKKFIEIKDNLTHDEIVYLMYSINPATRLTAIETYYINRNNFPDSTALDQWAETNFNEIPEMDVLMGCFSEKWETRMLVYLYMTIKYDDE